ncbi:hypothetical protein KFL_004430030 [Klebsormidium nitens]|uniref:ATPase AAA-type core domain-containing protein n=1 Tax=Klebsormidium nitens TaxID=105231 RepID=A0A1Y1IKH6_KLENI|nr:hypothetical protein KFL_004430030 [Klebsormidium nitens]|eukprot:GAQ88598.1 hypothetical protein KFL_004430030 [Klebsormidium nitens]
MKSHRRKFGATARACRKPPGGPAFWGFAAPAGAGAASDALIRAAALAASASTVASEPLLVDARAQLGLKRAEGGVHFLDEAYRLIVPGSTIDFGNEALEQIMSQMDSGKLMCIFAGYETPMKKVLDCNEGFLIGGSGSSSKRATALDERLDVQCADLAALLTLTLANFEAAADGMSPVEAVPVAEPTTDPTDLICQLSRHVGSVLEREASSPGVELIDSPKQKRRWIHVPKSHRLVVQKKSVSQQGLFLES